MRRTLLRSLIGIAGLPSLTSSGCATEVESREGAETLDVVSTVSLETARQNEEALATAGYAFEGRVWVGPETHVDFFRDPAGGTFRMTAAPGTAEGARVMASLRAAPDLETLANLRGKRFTVSERPGDLNIIAFDSHGKFDSERTATSMPGVGVVRQALSNEHCDINEFNHLASHPIRWTATDAGGVTGHDAVAGQSRAEDINRTPALGVVPTRGRVTNFSSFLCADRGRAGMGFVEFDDAGGKTRVFLAAAQGEAQAIDRSWGFTQRNHCLTSTPFTGCVDWSVRVSFGSIPKFAVYSSQIPVEDTGNHHFAWYAGTIPYFDISDTKDDFCDGLECPFTSFDDIPVF